MEDLDREFLAWLAGFWEGEGSLIVTDKKTCFAVYQSGEGGKRILEEIKRTLGVGNIYERTRAGNPNTQYALHVCAVPSVTKLVAMLLPHIKFKNHEVERKLEVLKKIESMMVSLRVSRRCWTKDERKFLEENYGKLSVIEISERLGRTYGAVNNQIWWMGLKKEPSIEPWTPKEEGKLRKLTEIGYTAEQISKDLGRTVPSIYNRWRRLGIHGKYTPDPTRAINTRREIWKLQRMARGASGVNPTYI